MGFSREDLLKRARYGRRVQYDLAPPARAEMIEPSSRSERLFRLVKPSAPRSGLPPVAPARPKPPGLTPTQDKLINEIPQKYDKKRHEVRSFLVNYLASRDPAALVKHLEKHFDYPAPEGFSFDTSIMGPKAAQGHVKKIEGYVSQLEHHLHRQGNKNYGHEIIKAMGDHIDKIHSTDKVLRQMEQHFGNQ